MTAPRVIRDEVAIMADLYEVTVRAEELQRELAEARRVAAAEWSRAELEHLPDPPPRASYKPGTRCECGAPWDPETGGYRCAR